MSSCDPLPGLIPLSLTTDALITRQNSLLLICECLCISNSAVCFSSKKKLYFKGVPRVRWGGEQGGRDSTVVIGKVILSTSKDLISKFWTCYCK